MIGKIMHLGIAVRDIEKALRFYSEIFSLQPESCETFQDFKAVFLPLGDSAVELLQPTSGSGVIAKFLEKRGEGLHHVAYKVNNLEKILEHMKASGVELIDRIPRPGAHGSMVAFLNPKSCHGVLIELVEEAKGNKLGS